MSSHKVLIDSHVLVWLLYEPEKLSTQARTLLLDAPVVYVSVVSLWELALKFTNGKLKYTPTELMKGVDVLNLERLALRDEHILASLSATLPHKDPFDGLLVAQAKTEDCVFVTADTQILASPYHTFSV